MKRVLFSTQIMESFTNIHILKRDIKWTSFYLFSHEKWHILLHLLFKRVIAEKKSTKKQHQQKNNPKQCTIWSRFFTDSSVHSLA